MRYSTLAALAASTIAIAAVVAQPAYAQDTTSAIAGQVTAESGAPVGGAKVTILHTPTGTRETVTTDGTGNFAMRGLRVGGPYTVTVEAAGQPTQIYDNVMLTLGDTFSLPVIMQKQIIVAGLQARGGRQLITGSETSFRAKDIQDIVSARRDVRDVMRRDLLSGFNPNAGGVSIAGGNIRTQRFSVDGVQMQDSFGLNYGGLPSSRGIVSLEMIDQLSVKAAPFDISEGNFQGGAVNVVLKSGGNKFHMTAFGNFGGPGLNGTKTADTLVVPGSGASVLPTKILPFTNFGGSISGPIIKDKLFFAAAYERLTEGTPDLWGPMDGTASNAVTNLHTGDFTVPSGTYLNGSNYYPYGQNVIAWNAANPTNQFVDPGTGTFGNVMPGLTTLYNTFNKYYGNYNIGTVPTSINEVDEKYAAKLDWNVTEGHRVSVSYIHHENVLPSFYSGVGGSNSATSPYILLLSDFYKLTEHTDAFSGQWNGKWTDRLSSEVRVAYKYYRRGQDAYNGPDYAQMNVCMDPTSSSLAAAASGTQYANETTCSNGSPTVRMGPDTARQANKFRNRIYTYQGNLSYRAGAHTFKLEYDHNYSTLYNLFVYGGSGLAGSGGPNGLYYFDSMADFAAKQANELALTTTTTGNKNDGFVSWAYHTNTVGFQDTWKAQSNLTINGGFRYDWYTADNTIAQNANFTARYSVLYPGLTNTATLDGRHKFEPRIGFNWQPTHTLKVAGGLGLFAGGLSDVFISNNYSNSGAPQGINGSGAAITSVDIVRLANGSCIDRSTGTVNPTWNGASICADALSNVNGATIPSDVLNYAAHNTSVLANTYTNFLDPKFKLPAQWKYNITLSWHPDFTKLGLGDGWTFRTDVLFSDTQSGVRWVDLRAQPLVVNGVVQTTPDGRTRYGGTLNTANGAVQPGSNYDMELTNTKRGISRVFAIGATKSWKDFDVSASYTHTRVHDIAGALSSSTVSSSYSVPTDDANSGGAYGRSAFEISSIVRANINFHHKFFGDNETRLGINWELRSGQPYSITMNDYTTNSTNGRSGVFGTVLNTTSQLLYVPNFANCSGLTCGNVTFDSASTMANLQKLVNGTKLYNYQGAIAPKNLMTGPSYNKIDLNFAQQIPVPRLGRGKLTALFSIENFLNMLNRDWGTYQDIGATAVVKVACVAVGGNACGQYLYSSYSSPKAQAYIKPSLYAIRAGVRFDF